MSIRNSDIFLINRDGVDYQVPAKELKDFINRINWESHEGVTFHLILTERDSCKIDNTRNDFILCTLEGQEVVIGDPTNKAGDYILLAPEDCHRIFHDSPGTWDFGEHTDLSTCEDISGLFEKCSNFNGKLGGNWDLSDVTNMSTSFKVFSSFNQDI